jgi:XTP/dITP diphosphohydrolase|tara:strand:+ start:354 stop:902 length:549 start_codon:yes stop_codon:yes gene_type:complete
MHLTLITSNHGKLKELKGYLEPEITIDHISTPYTEMRSDDPEEITKLAAKQNAEKLKKPVIVEDSGLFIGSLNDFPGTCSAYIHKRIGLKGILSLMQGIDDRTCFYKSAVGYCEPGKEPLSFLGEEKGKIALEEKGSSGFGHDPIFIPENSEKTYGEMGEEFKKFRKIAVNKLKEYLLNKER